MKEEIKNLVNRFTLNENENSTPYYIISHSYIYQEIEE